MARDLGEHVESFRVRSLVDARSFTLVGADALVLKVREGGRVVGVHTLVATGVSADGHREIVGLQVTTSEDGADWLGFLRDLVARDQSRVELVNSYAHAGLVAAIGATLDGAVWQRCCSHDAANLMSVTPRSYWPWVKALLHLIYDQFDAPSAQAQFDRANDALAGKLPAVSDHLENARRWKVLDEEVRDLSRQIHQLVRATAPPLVDMFGVSRELAGQFLVTAGDNPERITSEVAFAKLYGVAPQPASSGRTTGRHRLSRGRDQAANSAFYIAAIVRMRHHEPTKAYVKRRTAKGLSKREIDRCLEHYLVREVYANLPRQTRQAPSMAA